MATIPFNGGIKDMNRESSGGYRYSNQPRGSHSRGRRGRRGVPNSPKPNLQELTEQLHKEFPHESVIVEAVLQDYQGENLDSLKRRVKDMRYAYEPVQRNEFADLAPVVRNYLEMFQVSSCPEHCKQETCTYYHTHLGQKIRRRPVRMRNGIWQYLPYQCLEEGCGDESCAFSHSLNEVLYHPMTYKTKTCDYALTPKGLCGKYGSHCPFVHGEREEEELPGFPYSRSDLELKPPPVHTIEDQRKYNESMRHYSDTYVSLATTRKSKVADVEHTVTDNDMQFNRERYKVLPCENFGCKRDEKCLCFHSLEERRREDDSLYSQQPCGYVFNDVSKQFGDPGKCLFGDRCQYAHTENEVFYHKHIFRKKPCLNFLQRSSCSHPNCPFMHEKNPNPRLPITHLQSSLPLEDHKLQPAEINTSMTDHASKVRLEISRLKHLVELAEEDLKRLEVSSKCTSCPRNEQMYAFVCGHAICDGCAADYLNTKRFNCKRCNKQSTTLIRFAE